LVVQPFSKGMGGDKLLEQIFNLKFTAKQLNRSSIKCEQEERAERLKVKKAMEKGNMEGAKIYAQNAIRKKHEALNYMKLASRLDAVVSRLDTQAKMQMVNKNMAAITKNLEKALAANNLEKIAATMQQFEKQFENLDLQTQVVDGVMSQQAALSTPEEEVGALMQQVADEHGLEVQLGLPGASMAVAQQQAAPQDNLSARLAELKGR
jgi:charged multivesicular body protein 1